jgi:Flp pilus assembly protein TadD
MKKLIVVAVALVATLGSAGEVAAQAWSGSGRIKGTVTDSDGSPIKGAQVSYRMVSEPDTGPPPFITDKKGRFSFLGLRGTLWRVHAEAEGYHPSEAVVAEVFSTGVSDPVNIVLEKIPEEELRAVARWEANKFLNEGDALREKGDFAEARALYEQALGEIDESDYPTVYAAIGGTYLNQGMVPEAKEVLGKSLAINPDHVSSLKAMCAIVASEGRVDEAEAILARIPADEPMDANTLLNIGMSHYNQGEAEKAKIFLDRAIRDNPEIAQAYYFRGLVGLSLGDEEGARADLEHCLVLDPDGPHAAEAKEYLGYLGGAEPQQ